MTQHTMVSEKQPEHSHDASLAQSRHHSGVRPTRPRPRTEAEIAAVRVKNRRREYLERNPGYFSSAEHEFADPLLYDDLIRRFQSPTERQAEGKAKGYGRVLEGSLLRGEARLAKIKPDDEANADGADGADASVVAAREVTAKEADDLSLLPAPEHREEAEERWREFLRNRFVRGGDEDFDYETVDGNEEYDAWERRDQEEAWFEDEVPDWASEGGDYGTGGAGEGREARMLEGETGIQDY
ncbi:hypothetical protein DL546_006314 [Coniochaeta pulveracea]|uniref:CCD97-like C-terminal domain-containing protein n=1 Tax=Coniochaeta pulveracea TaxID=177199 RepID=A0A420Y711_9PEZI|nr:hypothetical protein DL546_006314 [Coniochaeta pulveracea]